LLLRSTHGQGLWIASLVKSVNRVLVLGLVSRNSVVESRWHRWLRRASRPLFRAQGTRRFRAKTTLRFQEPKEYGARARCWFKAATVVTPTPNPDVPNPTPNPNPNPNPNPTPDPLPVPGVAKTPLLNGQTVVVVGNPNQNLIFSWDVSNIAGAGGIYFEVIGPNRDFSVPNGTQPDPSAMPGGSFALVRGSISVNPARQLPGRGEYKFRVIPLDRTGRIPKGRYSNPAILRLQ
jgi:hypothetical protein